MLVNFLKKIFGQVSWQSPVWLRILRYQVRMYPKLFWGTSLSIIIVLLSGFGIYKWYRNLPHPELVSAQITAPKISNYDPILLPDTLSIDFSKSVAPLKQIGKEPAAQSITLTPAAPGHWLWQTDSKLVFTPVNDWPAGEKYSITFNKDLFTPGTKMQHWEYAFNTQPFAVDIAEFKFYQDPRNPQIHQAVATLNFNYPVDTHSLENNITLLMEAIKKDKLNLDALHFHYTIDYDKYKRNAYIHSESLPLPAIPRYLALVINKGVKPIAGPAATETPTTKTVLIPDAGSFFKVSNIAASIIRNEKDNPEQVLNIETTIGIKQEDLNKVLHVYLLPKDAPATALQKEKIDYEWQNPGEVTPEILALATPINLQTIPADRDYATLHSFKFNAPAPRNIYVKIDKGAHGFADFTLAENFSTVMAVPAYPKEINLLHKGALLALNSEKKISVLVRGLPAVKFDIARVLPDDINQLVTQTGGDFSDPRFENPNFNENNISEIFSEIRPFDTSDLSHAQYNILDLSKYLASESSTGKPLGLFILKATGWDSAKKLPLDVKTSRLILITDMGLLVKDNNDGTHDVFVQSITQGTPLANVDITILGRNGLAILSRKTDAEGHANFPTLSDFHDDRNPTVWLARNDKDVSFIPYDKFDRQLNYSRFDVGGTYANNGEAQTLSAFLFTDRGIYRPGDTAHIGIVLKQAYAEPQPAGLPLQVSITDPRGLTVQDQKITLNDTGYLTLDFKTNTTSPTGQYLINLYLVKDNHASAFLGTTALQVQEFLPDRLRITTHLSQETTAGWITPAGLTAKVGLWNLYGAPATARKITGRILLVPQTVHFSQYPDYIFADPLLDPNKPNKVFTDTLPEAKTDAQGQAEFDLNLQRFDQATYQLTFFSEGFEAEGGRSVTTQTTALVSPLNYFVGYKGDGDLSFIKQNSPHEIHFLAVNPQLKTHALDNLHIQFSIKRPIVTLVKKPDGTYQYQSIIQTTLIKSLPFAIAEPGVNYPLATDQIGDFELAVIDQNGTCLSKLNYSVVGESQAPLPKNAELSVKLNKAEYAPDEDIEMQITAPYTGAGLITIERDKTYAHQWFKTNTTSSVQKIHIPKDFQGGGYVNIEFVRDWDAPEIFINPLSYAVVPFTVNRTSHTLHIDLNTPDTAQPGEPFIINYHSDKPGKIIVFAVDAGILQVANYKTPDPLGFFFQKRALQVQTQQIVDQILPKFIADRELSAAGGDGGQAAIGKNLNPFKRKTDLPVVYWSGIVDTDTTPRQLTYPVPDYFNGSLQVMAVAVANNAVGSASKTAEIRGHFVINPNVPTFVAPGDTFTVSASIANNVKSSGANANIVVQLAASPHFEIVGANNQTLTIPENQEQTVHFNLRAKEELGAGQLFFTAKLDDKISKMTSTLSVRPPVAFHTTINSAYSSKPTTVTLDRALYPEYRSVEAAASVSPLILVSGLMRYLDDFPYACTEQLTSKAFAALALANQPWATQDQAASTEKIQTIIQLLRQRQMSNGSFSYWPSAGDNAADEFSSVYAIHFLTEAKGQGYNVPSDMLRLGLNYLKDLAEQDFTNLTHARAQAYAIYLLTRNEIVTTNYLTHLELGLNQDPKQAWHQDIISTYLAATYQLLKSAAQAEKLIAYYQPNIIPNETSGDFYTKDIANVQYLFLIAKHFPERLPKLNDTLVMPLISALNSDSISTLLSGYSSVALAAYAQSNANSANPELTISESGSNHQLSQFTTKNNFYQKVNISNFAKQIIFTNKDKQNYFYQIAQAGFDKTLPNQIIKQNLEINREYRNDHDQVVQTINLGDELTVHIQLRALGNRDLTNIAIVDLLPGGFEVVRDSVQTNAINYADIREDRVVFFVSANPNAQEIIYRIKATNAGEYTVPPIFAGSMYDPHIQAQGLLEKFVVTKN